MKRRIAGWILYGLLGFKADIMESLPKKAILCVAPHTSNSDFFIAELCIMSKRLQVWFLMKEFWFHWPFCLLLKRMHGIPVNREHHEHLTDQLIELARENESFLLAITPEGTRKPTSEWKHGFYYIAQEAGIPILLCGIDYEKKLIVCRESFEPTGDIDEDMVKIKEYFQNFKGRHPERFII